MGAILCDECINKLAFLSQLSTLAILPLAMKSALPVKCHLMNMGLFAPCTSCKCHSFHKSSFLQYDRSEESEQTKNMARIIFDSALLESGYELSSPKDFNQRIYEVLAQSLQTKTDFRKGTEFESEVCPVSTIALAVLCIIMSGGF